MDHQVRVKKIADTEVWQYEELFWLNGQSFFRKHMDPNALMVFAEPIGVMTGEDVLASLTDAPRWETVDFAGRSSVSNGDTIVLAYRVSAERAGTDTYHALCSSTYVRRDEAWVLLAHSQTPAPQHATE